ncbi:MAG: MFS transporter [Segniliparus sp.]|uniref:MFS transporter n=1 Tax=Segniliparus sp. TaxID=2804064 RepID=UPI003F349EC3
MSAPTTGQERASPARPQGRAEERDVPLRLSASLGTGSMLQPLNSSMIGVALVGIATQFGSASSVAWVLSAFYITSAVSSTVSGALAEMFGPKRVYLVGLAAIALSAVVGGLAPNLAVLLLARVLLAIGTGTQYPSAMTIVRRYADDHNARASSAIVVLSVCSLSVVALGPTIGGVLVGVWGWQSIFWVNVPVAALAAFLVSAVAPKDGPITRLGFAQRLRRLDLPGMGAFALTVTCSMLFLLSLTTSPDWWWLVAAAVLGGAFVGLERRAPYPFVEVRSLTGNRTLATTMLRALCTYIAFYLVFLEIPQWLQTARALSPEHGGLVQLPMAVVGVFATIAAGRVYARAGAVSTLLTGTLSLLVGGAALGFGVRHDSPWLLLMAVFLVLGVPNGFNNIGNQNLVESSARPHELGVALGFYRTVQSIGALVAAAIIFFAQHGAGSADTVLHRVGLAVGVIGLVLTAEVVLRRKALARR